jgi:CubicO group peptidase (beta-lactamase class C family)
LDLATHSSGLPREQGDFEPKDPIHPRADYTPQVLYAFLSRYTLDHSPGEHYLYSNLGFGLLGQLLSLRAGQSYEELVASRITRVLGLQETSLNVPSAQRSQLAQPTANGLPGASSQLGALAPAGALRSTAHDLIRWVAAQLHPSGPLAQAMTSTQSPRRAAQPDGDTEEPRAGRHQQIGLAWQILPTGDDEIVWHSGGTSGYRSFVGFRRGADRGVVILTNSRFGVDDIGLHLLDPESPLQTWTLFANASLARATPVHASSERVKQGRKSVGSWDFSAGAELWGVRPAPDTREVASRVRDGSLCASLHAADNAFVTWPDPGLAITSDGFALAQGTRYRLSFRARASGPLRLFAAVGHVSPPYTHAVEASVPVQPAQRWFSVDFEPRQADERAGIGFWASASPLSKSSELCIDDVVLSALD